MSKFENLRPTQLGLRSSKGASGISEFGPTLIVLFMIIFPCIDLIGAACGFCTLELLARQAATRAANANDFTSAIGSMTQESKTITDSGLGKFAKLQPAGGITNCGTDLFIKETDIHTSQIKVIGPNKPLPGAVDTANHIYEAEAKVNFDVGPLVSFGAFPVLRDVPGLGKPLRVTVQWDRALEHPEKYSIDYLAKVAGSFSASSGAGSGSGGGGGGSSMGEWNYPIVPKFQPMPGQTILAQEDIIIPATVLWKQTSIVVGNNNRLSFDFLANGMWSFDADSNPQPPVDADGNQVGGSSKVEFPDGLPTGMLIGRVGNGPIFGIGKNLTNFSPVGTGPLYMMINDQDLSDNAGEQNVRVYLTN